MSHADRGAPKDPSALRRRAEKLLSAHLSEPAALSPEEVQRLVHELEVHQIELEMQNSQLREAQEQLEASRDRYADLYDFAPLGYVSLDSGGSIRESNLTAAAMLGTERAGLIGKTLVRWVAEMDREVLRDHLRRCGSGEEEVNSDLSLVASGDRAVRVHLRSIPVREPERVATLYRTAITDITERIKIEDEQRKLEAQLRQAQKLESLGVLAGGIAHDFNNLLTAILANAELLLKGLSPSSTTRPNIEEIKTAAVRATDLTTQMLAYAGSGGFQIEPFNLNELVEETSQLLHASISKEALLRLEFAQDLPDVDGDAGQIRQIVMNLIINASEAGGDEGVVITLRTSAVEASRADLSETYQDQRLPTGRYVCLEVSDTGCGIDEETKSKLFDPFFTTKFTGRGLGLAAVLGIVRSHHGTVDIQSRPGKGTTFKVLLPVAQQVRQVASEPRPADTRADLGETGTVLIVDDEESVRKATGWILISSGFTILTAPDGQTAIELFAERPDEIAVVLLDLTMPGMRSDETLKELQRIRSDVPVIICSGYSKENVASRFTGRGPAGFLQKPYEMETLVGKIRDAIGSRSLSGPDRGSDS
jgi:two-component system cell cycle sensor histidine kinase/response regulator CckA